MIYEVACAFQERSLEFACLLRSREFKNQMVTEVPLILPGVIAQGTVRAIDQIKTLFNQSPTLQGSKQCGIAFESCYTRKDRGRFLFAKGEKRAECVSQSIQIA